MTDIAMKSYLKENKELDYTTLGSSVISTPKATSYHSISVALLNSLVAL